MQQDDGVKRFMRLVTSFAIRGCQEKADHHRRAYICLDEFAQLGPAFKPVTSGLATLRSANIKLHVLTQNWGQMLENYPTSHGTFLANCDQQYFGVNDHVTAKTISDQLGNFMEPMAEGRRFDRERPLRAPAEVLDDLRKGSGMSYVLPVNGLPMTIKLVPFNRMRRGYGTAK